MNRKNNFITLYNNTLSKHPLFLDMMTVKEDSPYHREDSVAIHTNMVVAQYISRINNDWSKLDVCGALACAFHDVGKPSALLWKHSDERGDYKTFGGHETISARFWEDYYTTNYNMLTSLFELTLDHMYIIGWMIEHHLPFSTKDITKIQRYAYTLKQYNAFDTFINVILSDTFGRISDDEETKQENSKKWCEEFTLIYNELPQRPNFDIDSPQLYIPIACSGSGKSTLFNRLDHDNEYIFHYSLDNLRHKWYDEKDYNNAFKLSCEDKDFKNKSNSEFIKNLKLGYNIYLDNMNLSTKSRNFFISEARKKGYKIVALMLPVSIDTVVTRQTTRTDKTLSSDVVKNQYLSLSLPQIGEVDLIVIFDTNL